MAIKTLDNPLTIKTRGMGSPFPHRRINNGIVRKLSNKLCDGLLFSLSCSMTFDGHALFDVLNRPIAWHMFDYQMSIWHDN